MIRAYRDRYRASGMHVTTTPSIDGMQMIVEWRRSARP
jgi:hypothetical protein